MFAPRCFTVWRTVLRSSLRSTAAGGSIICSVTLLIGSAFAGVYRLWAMFCMPGLRVPFRLKVPFLPSTIEQTVNVIKLLEGRKGHLADLGSGDGRLAFAASSMGFQCTGFEINSILLACSRSKAWWRGVPHSHIHFVKQDFWKTNLSKYRNVTVFLAPAVMGVLEEKLLKELPEDRTVQNIFSPITGLNQPSGLQ
ncbi:protein FAM173B-like [Sinocyclocheilus anshuiensis]|uniref:protein FAM173B-like n=1 Tax=Sinocyclocheilus anshuiensis TaxID=1608454 RepID=UPI0007B9BB67|nr:PREDICTED: protein FAM173B-like [Sinocyclocheilus anshuiensis]